MKSKPIKVTLSEADVSALESLTSKAGAAAVREAVLFYLKQHGKNGTSGSIQHGGNRWLQCGRCNGWNVGEQDGVLYCADCGWSSTGHTSTVED